MSQTPPTSASDAKPIIVSAKDLPLHCPTPSVALWNMHPRVFLDLVDTGAAKCPYCGTSYQLEPGTIVGHGH
jgi:uncharacterized Zn-finger protein